jgi:chemotaxis protein MotA
MDLMSILGWVAGAALMLMGIILGSTDTGYEIQFVNLSNFYDLPSFVIVLGGTIAALMVAFPAKFS